MKAATCAFVAREQLPAITACSPLAPGRVAALAFGAMPKFAGKPIATPEPAVTKGISASAGAKRCKSALLTASTIATPTPCCLSPAIRCWIAAVPCATTP